MWVLQMYFSAKKLDCRRRLYRPRRDVSRGQLKQTDVIVASGYMNRRNKRVGMSRKCRCNLARNEGKRRIIMTKWRIFHICLEYHTTYLAKRRRSGPINSAFDRFRKSIHNVHPGLLNYNHLIISNKIHEEHVAVPETNGEVTTRFDHGGCTRVRSFSLPSWPWYVIHRAWSSSLFLVGYMSSSSDMVRRENIGVLWNRLIEVNYAKVAMGALEVWRMVWEE